MNFLKLPLIFREKNYILSTSVQESAWKLYFLLNSAGSRKFHGEREQFL